jgi:hypothetical protein
MPSHDFHQKHPFVTFRGIADLVDGIDGRLNRRGKTDGEVGPQQVVIDRSWTTDDLAGPDFGERDTTPERPVATDWYQGIDLMPNEEGGGLFLARFRPELVAATAVQEGTPMPRPAGDTPSRHLGFPVAPHEEPFIQDSLVAAENAHDFVPFGESPAYDRSDASIHAGRIPAAAENTDPHLLDSLLKLGLSATLIPVIE